MISDSGLLFGATLYVWIQLYISTRLPGVASLISFDPLESPDWSPAAKYASKYTLSP